MSRSELPNITVPENLISRPCEDSKFFTRSHFERDRDRVLYSRPFRRLSGKTQVFLTSSHDYVRTRLTHTLEVAQVSRDIATYLGFDPVLAEAIALGHDLGHTPFGHVGERALNQLMNGCHSIAPCQAKMRQEHRGFKHNLQSCRVAQTLSRLYSGEGGLNLTNFTYWGMANHCDLTWGKCSYLDEGGTCRLRPFATRCRNRGVTRVCYYGKYLDYTLAVKDPASPAWSFEALIVRAADKIAQRHHDLEDALVTKVMNPKEVVDELTYKLGALLTGEEHEEDKYYLDAARQYAEEKHQPNQESAFIPYVSRFVLNLLKKRLMRNSERRLAQLYQQFGVQSQNEFCSAYPDIPLQEAEAAISYDEACAGSDAELWTLVRERVLNSYHAQRMDGVGTYVIRNLAEAYMANPQQLPDRVLGNLVIALEEGVPLEPRDPKVFGQYREKIKVMHNSSANAEFQILLLRTICDHIAGMTDRYAFVEYQQLYGSSPLRTFDAL